MMNIVEVLSIILLQTIVYGLGSYVLFREKQINFRLGTYILIACMLCYYVLRIETYNILYIQTCAILIKLALTEGTFKCRFINTIKIIYIVTCCEEMLEAIIAFIVLYMKDLSISAKAQYVLADSILIVIWLIVGCLKKSKLKLRRKHENIFIMISVAILSVVLLLVIASVQYAVPYVNNNKFTTKSYILTIISYFGTVVLGMFVMFVEKENVTYRSLLEAETLLRMSQKNNYEVMLKKEEETREFRHDISNFIVCLKEMLASENVIGANNFINEMQIAIQQIQKKNYTTGNEILDTIINYYAQQLSDDIAISVMGLCNMDLQINSVELCSVVSNPLQNAVEALNKQKNSNKYLKIEMYTFDKSFKIQISNSIDEEPIRLSDKLPLTNKQDKVRHGIGLKNVKKLVESAEGVFCINILKKEFQVIIILPEKN